MFIWLPPSEGKTSPSEGPTLDLETLSFPELTDRRTPLLAAIEVLGHDDSAAHILGLSPKGCAPALEANASVRSAPCTTASRLFSGVLFDALNLAGLEPTALRRAEHMVRIFSGLFGVLSPSDLIPNHRLAMSTRLPAFPTLSTYWREALTPALNSEATGNVILDCRSGPYRAACPRPAAQLIELAVVRQTGQKRHVISHEAKKWRGLVARAFLLSEADVESVESAEDVTTVIEGVLSSIRYVDSRGITHCAHACELGESTTRRGGGSHCCVTLVTT